MLADTLAGLSEGLAGWRQATPPASWQEVQRTIAALPAADQPAELARHARELAVLFGDGRALAAVRAVALDRAATADIRRTALRTLIEARPADLRKTCEQLLNDRTVQAEAARGLAVFDDPAVARLLVNASRRARGPAREAILSALVSRVTFATALVEAVENGQLKPTDLSAATVRQIHTLGNAALSRRLTAAWGQIRESPAEKQRQIADLTELLTTADDQPVNLPAGRLLFQQSCGNCHRLYGSGGDLGPDLTGSGRHDLGYLLENMVDPSAVVNRNWRMSVIALADGRVLSGVVMQRDANTLSLRTPRELIAVPVAEIDAVSLTDRSPMPDGLLDQLSEQQIRNLIAYLRHPTQVPLPESISSAADLP